MQFQAERLGNLEYGGETRISLGAERPIEAFAAKARIFGYLRHAFSASDITKRPRDTCGVGLNECLDPCPFGTRRKLPLAQQALGAQDMQDKDLVSVMAMEDATRWLHDLTVARPPEFWWPTATLRVVGQLLDVAEYAFDKLCCRDRAFQRDVVGNGIQVAQCRLRPDYFSHRARRFPA